MKEKLRINRKNVKVYRGLHDLVTYKSVEKNKYEDIIYAGEKVRIFNPSFAKKIIVYIHGGGFVAGSIDTHSYLCYVLAKDLKRKVISIDYGLAPEHPFPEGLNDCFKVVSNLVLDNPDEEIIIMGDSAGGNLAMGVSLLGLHQKKFRLSKIVLFYPSCQTEYSKNSKYKSIQENSGKSFLTMDSLQDYMRLYLKNEDDFENPYVNLLNNKKWYGLPKTMVVTGDLDPLHDEGVALVKKLKWHLVRVKHYDIKDAPHGFLSHKFNKKYIDKTIGQLKKFLGEENE